MKSCVRGVDFGSKLAENILRPLCTRQDKTRQHSVQRIFLVPPVWYSNSSSATSKMHFRAFQVWNRVQNLPSCSEIGYRFRPFSWGTIMPITFRRQKRKKSHIVWSVPYGVIRVAAIAVPHRVWSRVYIRRVRSEIGYGKSYILVWNGARVAFHAAGTACNTHTRTRFGRAEIWSK